MTLTIAALDAASAEEVATMLDGIYEHSPWVGAAAAAKRPFRTLAGLKRALVESVDEAGPSAQEKLILAHPELAGKAMVAATLTAESTGEQGRAGLTACTPEEFERLQILNHDYRARFRFPFILAVRGPRGEGLSRAEIIATFERRLANSRAFEFAENLRNIHRVAELRLDDRFDHQPEVGNRVWDRAEALAADSDPGYAERGQLTVTYLTAAHRACAARLADWMRESGFDEVGEDAVGNVVGVYHGADSAAGSSAKGGTRGASGSKRLLTGSHYDTVRNGGKYDGRLGILVPMACVERLARSRRRLAFGIEVVGFSEEEGQRFPAAFLGSGALVGGFDPEWLERRDADGITLREAMVGAGLAIDRIASLERDPARYLGFIEVHIEQGPVLNRRNLPLGVVTSINGGVRYVCEIIGTACHAGTTPMAMRSDAAVGAAELVLFVEQRAAKVPDLVATVGQLEVPNGSVNVVPGHCRFSLDIRATTDPVRDACVADVLGELAAICERRGLRHTVKETMRAAAAPSDAALQRRWEQAVTEIGLPLFRMPSGAGHDAMKLHEIMPQAMLFVRGLNAGISHNPLESVTNDDCDLAVSAMDAFLDRLHADLS
ncbi:MAG: 2-oxo-4-hydroxy-4-carboxy-5-ureidoimidazoline decarboxylase [Burkholderiaceae bacterium]